MHSLGLAMCILVGTAGETTVNEPAESTANEPAGTPAKLNYGLQIRPRAEKAFFGHLGVPSGLGALMGQPNYRTTMRSRLWLGGEVEGVAGKVSLQDVRTWGAEMSTLGDYSGDNIDFHEAWAQIGTGKNRLRVGRQEIAFDGQRLIGAVNWTQQGRAFDAVRFTHEEEAYDVDLFAARVADGSPHDLLAAHASAKVSGIRIAIPLILQTNNLLAEGERGAAIEGYYGFTGGMHASAKHHRLFWRAEAYAQTGENHLAYMGGVKVGYEVNSYAQPVLWVDYLSGDADHTDERTGSFDTLFATNHKFYGFMDRFLAIPGHTQNGGLIDFALKNSTKLPCGELDLAIHEFMLSQPDLAGREGLIGLEVDATFQVPLHKHVNLLAGAAVFVDQGDFESERSDAGAKTIHDWFFLQLDVNI